MKNLYFLTLVLFSISSSAQILIHADFQDTDFWNNPDNYATDPDDTDTDWVLYDSDGLPDANGRSQNWALYVD